MSEPATPLEALATALRRAAHHNANDQDAPAAVLWTDEDRRWERLVPALRERLPVLTLGPYDAARLTGPAIWVRCALDRTLGLELPGGTPVVYLPGIPRAELRAVDSCPPALQPVAELRYRGTWFGTPKGRDWTPLAFLKELDVTFKGDRATEEALELALERMFEESLPALRQQSPLSAGVLNQLLNPDPIRRLLAWLNDPNGQRASLQKDAAAWGAFVATCRAQCGFDPVRDGPVTAAGLLGRREGVWASVWAHFAEVPGLYRRIPALLSRASRRRWGCSTPART